MKKKTAIPLHAIDDFLRRSQNSKSLSEFVTKLRQSPTFVKASVTELLAEQLGDGNLTTTVDYKWEEGTQDKGRVAGRAAWALQELLGVDLPLVTPTSTKQDLEHARLAAIAAARSYRAGIFSLCAEYEIGKSSDILKKEYKDKIKMGISPDAAKYALVFEDLLREWFPLGKKIEELEKIVGAKPEPTHNGISYRFDTGYGGVEYRFILKDGIIVSIQIGGIY